MKYIGLVLDGWGLKEEDIEFTELTSEKMSSIQIKTKLIHNSKNFYC